MPKSNSIKTSQIAIALLLFAAILTVYLLTLMPGVTGGDPGELQFVPHILSMPHPTGTPLYCLLGSLWSRIPLGSSVAWRMNLLAAASAAAACVALFAAVYLIAQRLVPALAAAFCLAFGVTFWDQALLADKYAFNAWMVALILVLLLWWKKTRTDRALGLLALAYGLSLAHHRTMILFAPSLFGYVWWHERRALWRDRRRLFSLFALVLAPLLLYFYLPWAESRNLPPGTWHPQTLPEWYDYLFDTGRTGLVYVDPGDVIDQMLFFARTLQHDFTWVGVLLGLMGLAWLFFRRWIDALFLVVNFLLQSFLAANHHVPRHWVYFIPSFVLFALWVGLGISLIWSLVASLLRGRRLTRLLSLSAIGVLLLAWIALPFPERYRPFRASHFGAGVLDPWRQTLKTGFMGDRVGSAIHGVAADAIIICDWEQATTLWYFQQVEGLRPDVDIIYPVERLDQVAALGRPLYLARAQGGLAERWRPGASDALLALHTAPVRSLPSDVTPLSIQFDQVLTLARVSLGHPDGWGALEDKAPPIFYPSTVVPLTLYWRALEQPAHDYSVSLRLFDAAGQQVFKVDTQHPVLGTFPTSTWEPGEVVADYYEMQLAPDLAPGVYRWSVVVYRALPEGGWESLLVQDTAQEMATGTGIEVVDRN